MSNNYQNIVQNALISAASGTYIVDFDIGSWNTGPFSLLIQVTYATTSGQTGVALSIYDGFGTNAVSSTYSSGIPVVIGGDSNVQYNDTPTIYDISNPVSGSGSPQTTSQSLEVVNYFLSKWIRFSFQNNDPTNNCHLTILGVF